MSGEVKNVVYEHFASQVSKKGCIRAVLPANQLPNPFRGGLSDYTADRDDAAKPWLTVPNYIS